MRKLVPFFFLLLAAFQGNSQSTVNEKVNSTREELKSLLTSLREAMQKHDRAALETIYADEYQFIHASGYIDSKKVVIDGIMESDSLNYPQIPDFKDLALYGDLAIYRNQFRGTRGNSFVTTNVYIKRNGRWQILMVQGTRLLPERIPVRIDPNVWSTMTGTYDQASGQTASVSQLGDTLYVQLKGRPKQKLVPASETQYFDRIGSELNFYRDPDGKVTHFIIKTNNGQEVKWKKRE